MRTKETTNEAMFRTWWGSCLSSNVPVRFYPRTPGIDGDNDGIRLWDAALDAGLDALWRLCRKCLFHEAAKAPPYDESLRAKRRRIGDYDLGAQLGRGGMGVVYEAVQVSLRRPVALKMILDSEGGSPMAHRRFRLEAEAAAKLDHPNIVPIYEVDEYDGQPFISMKFIVGRSVDHEQPDGNPGCHWASSPGFNSPVIYKALCKGGTTEQPPCSHAVRPKSLSFRLSRQLGPCHNFTGKENTATRCPE